MTGEDVAGKNCGACKGKRMKARDMRKKSWRHVFSCNKKIVIIRVGRRNTPMCLTRGSNEYLLFRKILSPHIKQIYY